MKRFLIYISIILLTNSCLSGLQEEQFPIDVNVRDIEEFIALNGKIERDSFAWVQISYSQDIDSDILTPINFEENAEVIISNSEGEEETLIHKNDGVYFGSSLKGKVGVTYTLTVKANGNEYTALSTMLPARGYKDFKLLGVSFVSKGGYEYSVYSEEWTLNDPANERNRYLFEWWTNGVHLVRSDWAIDDDRVVNVDGGLSLFNPTREIYSNEHSRFRFAEINIETYNYYNMYEKIVRGMVGVNSQTPYNPSSNFGEGTIGNFRAIDFAEMIVNTPPDLYLSIDGNTVEIEFLSNKYYKKYYLYWSNSPEVDEQSNKIKNIQGSGNNEMLVFEHSNLSNGTYYYKIQAIDYDGVESVLSPEFIIEL